MQTTLAEWIQYLQKGPIFENTHYRGITIWKSPLDLWIFQEIIHETRPRVIVEIGSRFGGTTQFMADLLELRGGEGMVISVDPDRTGYSATHPRIRAITGSSLDPGVIREVTALCSTGENMIVHDGDHTRANVLRDLQSYSPLVGVGHYFIVEDGIMDVFWPGVSPGSYGDGPLAAIDDFLQMTSAFVPDASRERYRITYNPRGYLRRVRPA
jgi:cephalosporin hydroxylase